MNIVFKKLIRLVTFQTKKKKELFSSVSFDHLLR